MKKIRLECSNCGYVGNIIPDESVNGNYEIEYCPSCGDIDINIEEEEYSENNW